MTQHNPPPGIPDAAWAPLPAGAVLLAVGLFGLAAHQLPQPRPGCCVAGGNPGAGLLASCAGVWVFGAADTPRVLSAHVLTAPRVLAPTLTLLVSLVRCAPHPPAAA